MKSKFKRSVNNHESRNKKTAENDFFPPHIHTYHTMSQSLSVIHDTLRYIKDRHDIEIDINNIPLDNLETYQFLCCGDTEGVLYMQYSGMKALVALCKPHSIEDIAVLIALFMPDLFKLIPEFIARRQGSVKINYEAPEMEEILKETYGIMLYKEQLMKIASVIGGYTITEADNLYRLMSANRPYNVKYERQRFLEGARSKNIPQVKSKSIWRQMKVFARYSRNKSEIFSLAVTTYQTAWLKVHFKEEFMGAINKMEAVNEYVI